MALSRYSATSRYRAQLRIVDDLLALEEALRSYRRRAKRLRAKEAAISPATESSDARLAARARARLSDLQSRSRAYEQCIQVLRYGRWLYRYIGDGIAWRSYRYGRRAIRALAAKQPVPFLSTRERGKPELRFLRAVRALGPRWFPLLHDITNCLRTGDVTIFKAGRFVCLVELKGNRAMILSDSTPSHRGRPSGRAGRQVRRTAQVLDFLETGDLGTLDAELAGGRALQTESPERHHFAALSAVIAAARRRGYAFRAPDPGIIYLAWRPPDENIDESIQRACAAQPDFFASPGTFRAITPRYEQNHPGLPVTAMQLPIRAMLDLLFGRIAVVCMVNFRQVEDYCHARGVPLHFDFQGQHKFRIMLRAEGLEAEVLEGIWNRLILEALDLDSFVGLALTLMHHLDLSDPAALEPTIRPLGAWVAGISPDASKSTREPT